MSDTIVRILDTTEGYGGSFEIATDLSVRPCAVLPEGVDSTVITTTEATRIPLARRAGIIGVNVEGSGARVLVSFDGGETWLSNKVFIGYSPDQSGTVNMIPVMTSNTAPSGVASASSENSTSNQAWKAMDNNKDTFWISVGAGSAWIQYKFSSGIVVNKYNIDNSGASAGPTPNSWSFLGSNDGTNWTILDTQTDQANWSSSLNRSYSFPNQAAYLYYRLNIISSLNGAQIYLGTLALYEALPLYGWGPVDINEIAEKGMTPEEISTITQAQWQEVFQPTGIDFAVYLDDSLSSYGDTNIYPATVVKTVSYNGFYAYSSEYIPEDMVITAVNLQRWNNNTVGTYVYLYSGGGLYATVVPNPSNSTTVWWYNTQMKAIDKVVWVAPNVSSSSYAVMFKSEIYATKKIAYLKSITVILPENYPPAITDIHITPDTTHNQDVVLTATITDAEGDEAFYRILVNGEPLTAYASNGSSYPIAETIPSDRLIVGTNAIDIQTKDEGQEGTPYTVYVTRTNALPAVVGVLNRLDFTATIMDADGDFVRYRVKVNGEPRTEWTAYAIPPINVAYTLHKLDILVGYQNTLTLEVQDSLGEVAVTDFDFVGQYYGLLFEDQDGPFADDKGNVLRYLDFGVMIAGANSSPQAIKLSNTTGQNLQSLTVTADSMPTIPGMEQPEVTVEFDSTMDFTRPVTTMPVLMLNDGSAADFWARLKTDRKSRTGGVFTLRAKGEVT